MERKLKLEIRAAREQQKKQGYFDGRFSPKFHKDKKKKQQKKCAEGPIKGTFFLLKNNFFL
jgi:hypothetical protein